MAKSITMKTDEIIGNIEYSGLVHHRFTVGDDGVTSYPREATQLAFIIGIYRELKRLNQLLRCPNVDLGFRSISKIRLMLAKKLEPKKKKARR